MDAVSCISRIRPSTNPMYKLDLEKAITTSDNLFAMKFRNEIDNEYNFPLYVGIVDLKKRYIQYLKWQ